MEQEIEKKFYHSSNGPLKRYFLDISLTAFSESVIVEVQNLWGSSFLTQYSN